MNSRAAVAADEHHRIAFILPSFAGGGAERVALSLLAHLDRSRFAPSLIVFDGQGPLRGELPDDVPLVDLGTPRLRHALPRLIGTLRVRRPAVIFSTLGYVNLALLGARPLLPASKLVIREANLPSLSLAHTPQPLLFRLGYRMLYRRADRVIATSQRMADELAQAYAVPRQRLSLLPNPVDEDKLRAAAAAPLRAEGAAVHLVAAGRLTHQKGFDRLPDLLAALPQACLTILGEGPEREAILAKARKLGVVDRLHFLGHVANPWPWFAGADAFVLPSRWEGMPNVALEALACGTPVIATPEAGGIAELAAAAPPGAVSVVSVGEPFAAAIAALTPRAERMLRPSLLPPAHRLDAVMATFHNLLAEVA